MSIAYSAVASGARGCPGCAILTAVAVTIRTGPIPNAFAVVSSVTAMGIATVWGPD